MSSSSRDRIKGTIALTAVLAVAVVLNGSGAATGRGSRGNAATQETYALEQATFASGFTIKKSAQAGGATLLEVPDAKQLVVENVSVTVSTAKNEHRPINLYLKLDKTGSFDIFEIPIPLFETGGFKHPSNGTKYETLGGTLPLSLHLDGRTLSVVGERNELAGAAKGDISVSIYLQGYYLDINPCTVGRAGGSNC